MFYCFWVICQKNLKLWRAPTTTEFNNFCWDFPPVSYLPISTKECSRFVLFCLDLELLAKIKKDLVSTHSQNPSLLHSVKDVRIRSYSDPHFPRIFPNPDWIQRDTPYLSVFRPNAGKKRTRITPNKDTFYALVVTQDRNKKKIDHLFVDIGK